MIRLPLTRRIIFGATALIFMLCQGAAFAAACKVMPTPADAPGIQAPCHESSNTDSAMADSSCQARCPTQFTTVKPPQLNLLVVAVLPVATMGIEPPPAVAPCPVAQNSSSDRAQPPPISRLYCRMLN